MAKESIVVAALFYGDHYDLADACASSLERIASSGVSADVSFRIGCNELGEKSTARVLEMVDNISKHAYAWLDLSTDNRFKYPVMRRLIRGDATLPGGVREISSDFFMWFDDDSRVCSGNMRQWVDLVLKAMKTSDMIGAIHSQQLLGQQKAWIKKQPWYAGKPSQGKAKFATGGWWTIRSSVLLKHDWPSEEIRHRGGDVMLGELCRQQGYRLSDFRHGLKINADLLTGKMNSSPRRGYDEKPVGWSG